MVELYPAYCFQCRRCRQPVFVTVTTLAFGGRREFILGDGSDEQHVRQICDLDVKVFELRMRGVNATHPGMNIQSVPAVVQCDTCHMEHQLEHLLRGGRLQDAGAFNCERCCREGFVTLQPLDERPVSADIQGLLAVMPEAMQSSHVGTDMLMMIACHRIVVAGNAVVAIDRISEASGRVNCLYCGTESDAKLLEPKPLR